MQIRSACAEDLEQIISLFENTVEYVNSKDYTKQQIEVWKNAKNPDIWLEKINNQFFYVAVIDRQIIGFSSLEATGYLDFMYVHHLYQRQGIALKLLKTVLFLASELNLTRIWASVSITAQPFFEKHGFEEFEEEQKSISGVTFKNALMEKVLG